MTEQQRRQAFKGHVSESVGVGTCDDATLTEAFRAHTAGQSNFTRRMVIAMAMMFDVTPKEIVLRCERLGLCKPDSWNWFVANGGITQDHIAEVRQSLARRQ